jgi:hypothetical protein
MAVILFAKEITAELSSVFILVQRSSVDHRTTDIAVTSILLLCHSSQLDHQFPFVRVNHPLLLPLIR